MEMLKSLIKHVKEFGAGEAHAKLENVEKTQGLIAVISVYDNQKPAYMVLEELYEWAEENDNVSLIRKIEQLEQDMSWNKSVAE